MVEFDNIESWKDQNSLNTEIDILNYFPMGTSLLNQTQWIESVLWDFIESIHNRPWSLLTYHH